MTEAPRPALKNPPPQLITSVSCHIQAVPHWCAASRNQHSTKCIVTSRTSFEHATADVNDEREERATSIPTVMPKTRGLPQSKGTQHKLHHHQQNQRIHCVSQRRIRQHFLEDISQKIQNTERGASNQQKPAAHTTAVFDDERSNDKKGRKESKSGARPTFMWNTRTKTTKLHD